MIPTAMPNGRFLKDLSDNELHMLEPWAQEMAEAEKNPTKPSLRDKVSRVGSLGLATAALAIALLPVIKAIHEQPSTASLVFSGAKKK